MRSIHKTCQCCGTEFWAGNLSAKWCSSRCSTRAYQRRRRGAPEADPGLAVVQATIIEEDDIPAAWTLPPAGTEERIWRGTAIQRREADGFVNATAMCKANGKRWHDYVRYDRTQEYITALADVVGEKPCGAAVAGNPADPIRWSAGFPADLIHTITTGPNHLRGTWIHPRLAIDLARWISPAFAVWMDGWFLESLAGSAPRLSKGVHVVAASKRGAAMIWHEVITAEVMGALGCLNPNHRHEHALPRSHRYTFTPAT